MATVALCLRPDALTGAQQDSAQGEQDGPAEVRRQHEFRAVQVAGICKAEPQRNRLQGRVFLETLTEDWTAHISKMR